LIKSWPQSEGAKKINSDLNFEKYWDEVKKVEVYKQFNQTIAYGICRDAYRQGGQDATTRPDQLDNFINIFSVLGSRCLMSHY